MAVEQLLRGLQGAVKDAVAASDLPTLPIAFWGRIFTPPDDQKWLELIHIPANRTDEYWGDERTYRGTLRLALHWPNDDMGAYPPMAILDSITAWFTKGRLMGPVKVSDVPDAAAPLDLPPETVYPVAIRYDGFVSI